MVKYYICNGFMFYGTTDTPFPTVSSAKIMKITAGQTYIKKDPQKYTLTKVRNICNGKNYVLTTKQQFIGNDGNIVNTMGKAKPFDTIEAACEFISENKCLVSKLGEYKVIDNSYRYCTIDHMFTKKPEPITSEPEIEKTPKNMTHKRIVLPKRIKNEVLNKSAGVCAICGLPLNGDFTVDHIVPLSNGGSNELSNLRATHCKCNKLKGSFSDNELQKLITAIVCNQIFEDPQSDLAKKMIRGMVRGSIKHNRINI